MQAKVNMFVGGELPRHVCSVFISGDCDVAGAPAHTVQLHSQDDCALLAAQMIQRWLGRTVGELTILDVDTLSGAAEVISAEEAHRRFAPACAYGSGGGLPNANSRDN